MLKEKTYPLACFVNNDHVHILVDLPTNITIENSVKLLKGSSSHWVNQQEEYKTKFSWGRGFGAFSVSESNADKVIDYIKHQKEHHKKKSFTEEYEGFLKAYKINVNR
jgi:REP element-mobilizing transposase RayT